jgi:hypothetical protein
MQWHPDQIPLKREGSVSHSNGQCAKAEVGKQASRNGDDAKKKAQEKLSGAAVTALFRHLIHSFDRLPPSKQAADVLIRRAAVDF